MSDYTQITTFTTKDSLPAGNSSKKVRGSEIDAELAAISTAIGTKLDSSDADTVYPSVTTGTFTGTWSGFSGTFNPTMTYFKYGSLVCIRIPNTTATSNDVLFTLAAASIPAAIRPAASTFVPCLVYDNGITVSGGASITSAGGINMLMGVVTGTALKMDTYGFTASGTKGFVTGVVLVYRT